jgi:hypothetical protein
MIAVVLLGLVNHKPKTMLCKVQGGVIICVLLVAHLFMHILQFYLYVCVCVCVCVCACLSLYLMAGNKIFC